MTSELGDRVLDLAGIESQLDTFAEERDWQQFHNPKNLVLALVAEAGELAELFQWLTPEESDELGDQLPRKSVEDELADVLQYVIRIAQRLDVDLNRALWRKLEENEARYDAEAVRGRAVKISREE